jgi:hypothetical protein
MFKAIFSLINTQATRRLWTYILRSLVGLLLFTIIAVAAVVFNYLVTVLLPGETPPLVSGLLRYTESAILILDVVLICFYQIGLVIRYLRDGWLSASGDIDD